MRRLSSTEINVLSQIEAEDLESLINSIKLKFKQ